ncbi:SH3 domain-binding protein 2 isoform X2 [Amia ocellicauda]
MACSEVSWPIPMKAIGAQNLLTMPGGVTQSGYLHKKGGTQINLLKWPLRFVIIHKGCVYYFKTSTSAAPQGAFSLNGYNRIMRAAEETTSSNVFPFKIVHFSKKHRTWYFSAASEEERKKWMLCLRKEIDYYHEKREIHVPSDSDSDADSFYGSIERPVDIKYSPEATDNDEYTIEDEDDDDEEDYLKPDGSPTSPGQPTVPPPAYPPPPVPYHKPQSRQESVSSLQVRAQPPLLLPPVPTKVLPKPVLQKKAPPPSPPPKRFESDKVSTQGHSKLPPPPLPFAPHLPPPPKGPKPQMIPKPPSPACIDKTLASKQMSATMPVCPSSEKKPPIGVGQFSATLPICSDLQAKLALRSANKPNIPIHKYNIQPPESETQGSLTTQKPGLYKPPIVPKPPAPSTKLKPKCPGQSIQRSSPEGQSFRSSVDEAPTHLRKLSQAKEEDSDEDYENVQLPDSVFINSKETSDAEKLFKDTNKGGSPQDGLYCIRNSGTKTTKVLVVWDAGLDKARNYRIFQEDSRFYLETYLTFPSLAALVEHYYLHPLPNHNTLVLQKPFGYTPPR